MKWIYIPPMLRAVCSFVSWDEKHKIYGWKVWWPKAILLKYRTETLQHSAHGLLVRLSLVITISSPCFFVSYAPVQDFFSTIFFHPCQNLLSYQFILVPTRTDPEFFVQARHQDIPIWKFTTYHAFEMSIEDFWVVVFIKPTTNFLYFIAATAKSTDLVCHFDFWAIFK